MLSTQEVLQEISHINGSTQECLNGLAISSGQGATNITPVTVKGGVVRVIDSATGDIAVTGTNWIENEKYGWFSVADVNSVSSEFDTAVTRTGTKTLKFSNTDTSGRCHVDTVSGAGPTISTTNSKYLIPIKSSTQYRLNFYYKTTNKTSGTICLAMTYNSSLTRLTQNSGPTVSGTNNWTLGTFTFTSDATATGLVIRFQNAVGAVEDTWIDVNSMTLEEVSSITNSGSFPALYYPKATAVTTTDNIDQSLVTDSGSVSFGDNTNLKKAQSFTPTKKNFTGFYFKKNSNTGTPTFDVEVSIQTDNAGVPSGTKIGTPVTITSAQWNSIADLTDNLVSITATLTPGTKYWQVFTPSAQGDGSNFRRLEFMTGGTGAYGLIGSTWTADGTKGLYFKTLYSKNTDNFTVATDTQTLRVTAPTVDGWANGTIIDTATLGLTPLTLAPGANNVYFSSNGPDTADGTVDASLQATIAGAYGDTAGLSTQEAANAWAGTTNLSIQQALNSKAGTTGLSGQEAVNTILNSL